MILTKKGEMAKNEWLEECPNPVNSQDTDRAWTEAGDGLAPEHKKLTGEKRLNKYLSDSSEVSVINT